jgi:hypothetical protein
MSCCTTSRCTRPPAGTPPPVPATPSLLRRTSSQELAPRAWGPAAPPWPPLPLRAQWQPSLRCVGMRGRGRGRGKGWARAMVDPCPLPAPPRLALVPPCLGRLMVPAGTVWGGPLVRCREAVGPREPKVPGHHPSHGPGHGPGPGPRHLGGAAAAAWAHPRAPHPPSAPGTPVATGRPPPASPACAPPPWWTACWTWTTWWTRGRRGRRREVSAGLAVGCPPRGTVCPRLVALRLALAMLAQCPPLPALRLQGRSPAPGADAPPPPAA